MKLYLLIGVYFISLSISAQGDRLRSYYDKIYKAEEYIMAGNLDSSFYFYSAAFKEKKNPFALHVYNYSVVCAKLSQHKKVSENFNRLLSLGFSLNKLKENPVFESFFQSDYGMALEKRKINIVYDVVYRNQIKKLCDDDQAFRIKQGNYAKYGDTIKKIDRRNVEQFLKLIRTKGFPTEQRIGVKEEELNNPLYSILIIHQSSGEWQQYNFSELVAANIKNGNIENRAGNFLWRRVTGMNFIELVRLRYVKPIDSIIKADPNANLSDLKNVTVIEESGWGYYPVSGEYEKKMNNEREPFYLDDYNAGFKKTLFSIKHPEYNFHGAGGKSFWHYTKYEDYKAEKLLLKFAE